MQCSLAVALEALGQMLLAAGAMLVFQTFRGIKLPPQLPLSEQERTHDDGRIGCDPMPRVAFPGSGAPGPRNLGCFHPPALPSPRQQGRDPDVHGPKSLICKHYCGIRGRVAADLISVTQGCRVASLGPRVAHRGPRIFEM
jgi:hypothetical protein